VGECATVGESRTEPQPTERDAHCHEIGTRLREATARRAGKTVRQSDTDEPDSQEGDVLVEGVPSACVPVADDEKAHEQQGAHGQKGERTELPTERKRRGDADYRREKEDGLDN
jgi:hypothetical protein